MRELHAGALAVTFWDAMMGVRAKRYSGHAGKTDGQEEPGSVVTNLKFPPLGSINYSLDGLNFGLLVFCSLKDTISQLMHLLLEGSKQTNKSWKQAVP